MKADAVVVGAGIAGVATAHALAANHGVGNVVIVDPRPPLSLTSDKSTECYRNFWPNRPMVHLMNRSIDLMEEYSIASGNAFALNRRGYLYVTASSATLDGLRESAEVSSGFGSGPVRIHDEAVTYQEEIEGFDLLANSQTLLHHFPFLSKVAVGALHVRRAGWFSAQQLGSWMLERARDAGASLVVDEVAAVDVGVNAVEAVRLESGGMIETPIVVDAAGPLSPAVARMGGFELPVSSELHLKVSFRDHRNTVPRSAPMMIWSDPQSIRWTEEERAELAARGRRGLIGEMPPFCHGRPEGGADSSYMVALWDYGRQHMEPRWPLPADPLYPEMVMRGMTTMIPGLTAYLDALPHSVVDGGYYSKTLENRPLIGPAGPSGFHLMAAMSGFGVMIAAGAADLLARHVVGSTLPDYAPSFLMSRYDDPGYRAEMTAMADSGQL